GQWAGLNRMSATRFLSELFPDAFDGWNITQMPSNESHTRGSQCLVLSRIRLLTPVPVVRWIVQLNGSKDGCVRIADHEINTQWQDLVQPDDSFRNILYLHDSGQLHLRQDDLGR